ncbi:MAG: hypothetical protein JOY54_18050 [Acidobacteriaceae bacterium]|nr:hypothetical protein [Acidobacteriaceae bacterium]
MRLKLVLGQVTFNAISLGALGIEDQDRRRPAYVKAVEPCAVFLDMGLDGEKFLVDEACDAFIRIRLGFQPNASPSSGSRAEINQDRPTDLWCVGERRINILAPVNQHVLMLFHLALERIWLQAHREVRFPLCVIQKAASHQ